jgi:hypothetical protein
MSRQTLRYEFATNKTSPLPLHPIWDVTARPVLARAACITHSAARLSIPTGTDPQLCVPPLRTVCLCRGWEATSIENHLPADPENRGSDRITRRRLSSRSALNPAIDFRPHLKPMSHSGGVKLRALENL